MKIGIIGDTHGNKEIIRKIVATMEPVDFWLHTGDYSSDGQYLASETGLNVYAVAGNCDRDATANIDEFYTLEGQRLWLTHGHRYMHAHQVRELVWWADKLEADIVVFGHTHVPVCKQEGDVFLFNPGSPTSPRGEKGPTYGVITLHEGELPQGIIIEIEKEVSL